MDRTVQLLESKKVLIGQLLQLPLENKVYSELSRGVFTLRLRVASLKMQTEKARKVLERRRRELEEVSNQYEMRRKKASPKPEFTVTLETYLRNPARFDKSFSALHPFRKLRAVAQSLHDERRSACMKLLSMYKFRQVSMRQQESESTEPALSELVGDFYSPEGISRDQSMRVLVLLHVTALTIQLTRVLDISVPFPLIFGTCVSSPCLHASPVVYETGCPAYPRILHPYKRVLLPLYSSEQSEQLLSVFDNATGLLLHDLKFISNIVNQANQIFPTNCTDPVALLASIMAVPQIGRELVCCSENSSLSSPSLAGSYSPSSASYRKSVIEQSVTEGGDWTLLEQL